MAVDISLAEAAGIPVQGWRVEEGELVLRFIAKDDRVLRCVCGRRHWIVETRHEDGRVVLAVKCHGCGTARALRLESPAAFPG